MANEGYELRKSDPDSARDSFRRIRRSALSDLQ
jgi:hypothetical protein